MTRTPSTRAQLITRRTYNRPLEDGTFETWTQTIDRCIGHQKWLWERAQRKALTFGQAEELDELRDLLLDRKVGLSGRTLWLGGTEIAKGRELSQFNCAGLVLSTIHDHVDMVWGLLNGVGVGFHPRPGSINGFQKPVKQIIVKRSERTLAQWEAGERGREHNVETWEPLTRTWTISIGDSAAAWAKSIGKLLAGKYPADTLVIDLREIRAAGMRLRGYGWISSGDQTLSVATEAIARIMSRKAGQLLSFANLHDIANWCGTILSTRRSAQIALCDYNTPDWREFAKFKKDFWVTGNNQRSQSNNSLVFWETPTKPQLTEIFQMMLDAGGSEPGFINGVTAKARAPWFAAFNPCFSGDTLIATSEGAFPIEQLVGKAVTLWDGEQWTAVDNFRVTGENQVLLKFTMHDGAELKVTPYHTMVLEDGRKIEAQYLQAGDKLKLADIEYDGEINEAGAYLKGFLAGDGTELPDGKPMLSLYAPKYQCEDRLVRSALEVPSTSLRTNGIEEPGFNEPLNGRKLMCGITGRRELSEWCGPAKRKLPARAFTWNRRSKREFLAGLFDADGTAADSKNGFGYQLSSIHRSFLMEVQTLLKSIGVRSTLGLMHKAQKRAMPGGEYQCQDCWRLALGQDDSVKLAMECTFSRLVSFVGKPTPYNMRSRAGKIKSIVIDSIAEKVYCCTVPTNNQLTPAIGVVTGNCVEILLADKGFCNLVNINLGAFKDDPAGLLRATYLISRANYRQTCVDLRDGVLQEAWHQNNNFLRLCGVSLTGQAMRPDLTAYDYRTIKNEAICGANSMAVELDMPRPKNVTCGKPEGCRPGDAITTTNEGIFTLDELLADHPEQQDWAYQAGALTVTQDDQRFKVTKTFRNGRKPVYEVSMNYGLTVRSTGNHPWFVKGAGFIETAELSEGDELELNLQAYRNATPTTLKVLDFSGEDLRRLDIQQPAEVNDDLAWLMGYLWGNGCMSPEKGRMRFISQHVDTLEKVQRVMSEQFGLAVKMSKCSDRDAYTVEYASMNLSTYLLENGFWKYGRDGEMTSIPLTVRTSSWKHVVSFLAGMFDADGCVSTTQGFPKLIFSTASDMMAEQFQHVAAACGLLFSRSLNSQGQNFQGKKHMWLMNLTKHVDQDAFQHFYGASVKVSSRAPGLVWVKGWRNHAPAVVSSVVEVGEMDTFDIEVDGDHWFYAGAVKSHNTLSKCMDATEGAHKPLAKYIFNNVVFSRHDPLVPLLRSANYTIFDHPSSAGDVVIALPVAWEGVEFTKVGDIEVNTETALDQLEHYKMLMDNFVEQNQSVTISYDPSEVPAIIDWLLTNWDHYVGVSFLLRADPTKTAADLGYPYLPQQPVTREQYESYVATLLPVNLEQDTGEAMLAIDDCSTGACPIR